MCWVGFMVAIFVKVGQELGGGRADKAKSFALVGVAVSFCRSLYMHLQVSLHALAGLVGVAVSFCRSLYMSLQVSLHVVGVAVSFCRSLSLYMSLCMHLQVSLHAFAGLFPCTCRSL